MLSLRMAASPDGLPLSGLGQLGAFGTILIILLSFGWYAYKRESNRADKSELEIARLNQLIQDKYVPSLEAATRAMSDSADALMLARDKRRA